MLGSPDDCDPNLIRFPIVLKERGDLAQKFAAIGVELGAWSAAPLSSDAIDHELFGYEFGVCPVAEGIAKRVVNLPVHPQLTGTDRETIVRTLMKGRKLA